jgi:acyl carrier protein
MGGDEIAVALLDHLTSASLPRRGEGLDSRTPLLDGTIDSLTLIELVGFVQETFSIPVPLHDVVPDHFATVGDLCRYIAAERARSPGLSAALAAAH